MWDQAWQNKVLVNLENSNINYAKKEGRENKRLKKKISKLQNNIQHPNNNEPQHQKEKLGNGKEINF